MHPESCRILLLADVGPFQRACVCLYCPGSWHSSCSKLLWHGEAELPSAWSANEEMCALCTAAHNPPMLVGALFASERKESALDVMAPLLIVSLLGRAPHQAAGGAADGAEPDEALMLLQRLANLLESYFHPSNTGQCERKPPAFLACVAEPATHMHAHIRDTSLTCVVGLSVAALCCMPVALLAPMPDLARMVRTWVARGLALRPCSTCMRANP